MGDRAGVAGRARERGDRATERLRALRAEAERRFPVITELAARLLSTGLLDAATRIAAWRWFAWLGAWLIVLLIQVDYGVSYALAGVEGVLTYLIAAPWRYFYVSGVLLFYGLALVGSRDFTSVGHFTAVLLGLACYPLTRGRPGGWDPIAWVRGLARRRHQPVAEPPAVGERARP